MFVKYLSICSSSLIGFFLYWLVGLVELLVGLEEDLGLLVVPGFLAVVDVLAFVARLAFASAFSSLAGRAGRQYKKKRVLRKALPHSF